MSRTYKHYIKKMNEDELKSWISKQKDLMLAVGAGAGSTPILTKIIYAQQILDNSL